MIAEFLRESAVFEPQEIEAMSGVLDDVCKKLAPSGDASAREVFAMRIIDLARRGERDPVKLRARVLAEANSGQSL